MLIGCSMRLRSELWPDHVMLQAHPWWNVVPSFLPPQPQGPLPLPPNDSPSPLVPGTPEVDFSALTLLVPLGKGVEGRTIPFRSDNLSYQGAVAGCLAHRWEGWLKIGAKTWILDVLREDYKIPFSAPYHSQPTSRNSEVIPQDHSKDKPFG
ncbi:hypothetical protein E2C01_014700 [Portunus trituberculatus]|uniref:Uncharacterized protein n=1 Tax=Portunus trituberculatus TaxID=210409 RepID=A0A5B7DKM9_PORTR|nr:hypothetical protein [Portunus trituberculatus]